MDMCYHHVYISSRTFLGTIIEIGSMVSFESILKNLATSHLFTPNACLGNVPKPRWVVLDWN